MGCCLKLGSKRLQEVIIALEFLFYILNLKLLSIVVVDDMI